MRPHPEPAAGRSGWIAAAFHAACAWDVLAAKPGNVSLASPGHGMAARDFLASAAACAAPLTRPGAPVGARIEAAVAASWAAVGCNTNLGIVLLCAPLAAAAERLPAALDSAPPAVREAALREALAAVLAGLDIADAAAAFRAIVRANPGGLGRAEVADVHAPPQLTLREAMALAAPRDRIARGYRDGGAELFDIGLAALAEAGFEAGAAHAEGAALARRPLDAAQDAPAAASGSRSARAVQRLFLAWLASASDSHIVRKHGEAVAQSVLAQAGAWRVRSGGDPGWAADPAWAQWDRTLKAASINPGTSADLVVASLFAAFCVAGPALQRGGTERV